MGKMIGYYNKEIEFNGCPGCAYARHEFELPCGIAFENDSFILSQDWELPILGFMIVSPKRCIKKFSEFTVCERNEMFDIVNKTINILRDAKVCDRFDVIFEEKENRHFHIWIMPRHKWMCDLTDDIIDNINVIFEYAKSNFRNEETYLQISKITAKISKEFTKNLW